MNVDAKSQGSVTSRVAARFPSRRTAIQAAALGLCTWKVGQGRADDPLLALADLKLSNHRESNVVFRRQQGIEQDDSANALPKVLPEPAVADGMDSADEQKALEDIPGRRLPMDELLRNAISAPFVTQVGKLKKVDETNSSRNVDIWFFVHGNWSVLKQLAEQQGSDFGSIVQGQTNELAGDSHVLEDSNLASRSIDRVENPQVREYYRNAGINLLDRVSLRFTNRLTLSQSEQSILAASELDERFSGDSEFPNTWRSISSDRDKKLGPPNVYSGWQQYVKATNLRSQPGVLLVEAHLWMQQPSGWFRGRDLLGSKIRVGAQSMVRKFRTHVKKAS